METIEILLKCVVEGYTVKLPNIELPGTEYQPVKKALERIGGKWNTRAQGFVFQEDPTELLASIQRGEAVNIKKDYQFFATPVSLANYLVSIAYDKCLVSLDNPKILEPSAGDGALVKAIVKHMPEVRVDCFELMELNRIKLQKVSGADILGNDFLEAVGQDTMKMITEQYDLVIANPPFTKNQDIDHIRAMYRCLKPGGFIVTIASPSWTFGQQKKQTEFKDWLDSIGATTEEVAAGQFKESGTGVSAVIITLQKPVDENAIIIKPKEEVTQEITKPACEPEQLEEPQYYLDNLIENNIKIGQGLNELQTMLNPVEEMDFFKQIAELINQPGDTLVITKKNDNLTVMLKMAAVSVPLVVTGTAQDLDEGYFAKVTAPVQQASGLSSNVEAFVKEAVGAAPAANETKPADAPKKSRSKAKTAEPVATGPEVSESEESATEANEAVEAVKSEAEVKAEEQAKRLEVYAKALKEAEKEAAEGNFGKAAEILREANEFASNVESHNEQVEFYLKKEAERSRILAFETHLKAANDLGDKGEFKQAIGELKAAKEFTDEQDKVTDLIKDFMAKALEKELAEM